MTPEGRSKVAIKKVLDVRKPDLWYYMPAANGYGRAGIPDFVICYFGAFVTVEAKAQGGRVSGLQQLVAIKIAEAGGIAITIWGDDMAPLVSTLDMIKNAPPAQ